MVNSIIEQTIDVFNQNKYRTDDRKVLNYTGTANEPLVNDILKRLNQGLLAEEVLHILTEEERIAKAEEVLRAEANQAKDLKVDVKKTKKELKITKIELDKVQSKLGETESELHQVEEKLTEAQEKLLAETKAKEVEIRAKEAEREAKEAEIRAKEAEREAKEMERQAREKAELENALLQKQIVELLEKMNNRDLNN